VRESGKLIPHSGRHYGPDTSWQRHDHARRPSCDTAIEGSAQRACGTVWAEPQISVVRHCRVRVTVRRRISISVCGRVSVAVCWSVSVAVCWGCSGQRCSANVHSVLPFFSHLANAGSYSAGSLLSGNGLDKGLVPSRTRANNKLRCDALTRAQNGRLEFLESTNEGGRSAFIRTTKPHSRAADGVSWVKIPG
jgi:hypothetical protein